MLTEGASKYGRYSTEYGMAGGSPRSRRRSSTSSGSSSEAVPVAATMILAAHSMNGLVNEFGMS